MGQGVVPALLEFCGDEAVFRLRRLILPFDARTAAKMKDCRWLEPSLVAQFDFLELSEMICAIRIL
jgi:hypothetical protein